MNIGGLPDLILAWLKSQGADLLSAPREQQQGAFKPGQQYDATVLENLPNGRSLVQVADKTLDMALPQQAKAGDVLRMTYVQAGPRPTFALNAPAAGTAQPVSVSQAAQQVNALTRYVPVTQSSPMPTASAATGLATGMQNVPAGAGQQAAASSQSGALAGAVAKPIVANPAVLLTAVPSGTGMAAATAMGSMPSAVTLAGEAVQGANPGMSARSNLMAAQGVSEGQASVAHVLPMRLQQTIKESGMFYESHLGKWVRGELSLETIQREPQAALAKAPGALLNHPDLDGMPEKAAALASRQLNMLEGGPFFWLGQIWPGQQMEWLVAERDAQDQRLEAEAQKWRSQLRLTLPRLGGVAADLDVGALGLRIRLTVQSPETLAKIKEALPELVQRMKQAELNLTSLQTGLADGQT